MLVNRDDSILLVVDMQARLVPKLQQPERLVAACKRLTDAARTLGVPVLATEQYSRGLGPTVPGLAALIPGDDRIEKICFASSMEPAFVARLESTGRRTVVMCGGEAHVCVLQSALGLHEAGWQVAVVADAVSARESVNTEVALARLRENGVEIVSAEMILFEWLARAGTTEFRRLLPLIK